MKQYIDFFKSQRSQVEKSCSPLLNKYRARALELFEEKGFPAYRSEDYQHTDINRLLEDDFGFYLGFTGEKIDPYQIFKCNLVTLTSYVQFTINGKFYHKELASHLPEGVFSGSLNEFSENYPDLFTKYYNTLAEDKGDGLSHFNTLFVQDGYVLYVPENVVIDKPIQLTNIFNTTIDSLINRRILIILEKGAQAKVLACDHTMNEKPKAALTQVTEIFVEDNAVFDFYELEESATNTIRLSANFVRQGASSNVMINNIILSNGITRNNYEVDLAGEYALSHLYGLAIGDKQNRVDNYTRINHNLPHCTSDELFKYILEEEAIGIFSGKINVALNAQKTQAYQTNRNLLGGDACRIYSKPQLEIYADDVKCSHGMTTGQLDESALFYMRSRGIHEAEARILLKYAFTDDVIQGIRLDSLRERLRLLVEKRFRGEPIKCKGCI